MRFIAAISLLTATMFGGLGACSDPTPAPFCVGGFVRTSPTGEQFCEGICVPDDCAEGNTCVDNRCVLKCDAHSDCLEDLSQSCAPAVEDKTGAAILTCQAHGAGTGIGIECPFATECDGRLSCITNGKACDVGQLQQLAQQCGGKADDCHLDLAACYGKTNCDVGKCPNGSACTVMPCKPEECSMPLVCITKGEGDTEAYCTKQDCKTDSDCPGDYYCGAIRDPREICNSNPQKGNSNLCGKVSINTACIEPSTFSETLYEGQACALRNTCLKRSECAPCETDLDCTGIANHCIAMPNETTKRCARECALDKDCGRDFSCDAVEGAGNVCVHKFGACAGTGKFCEPCLDDTDCGPLDGTSVCFTHNDGQRGCGDISFPFSCTSDADCPTSPSGLHAYCVLDDPNSPLYQKCYIFAQNALDKYTCW